MSSQWNRVICNMRNAGIYISEDRDDIEWQAKKGSPLVLVRDIYLSLIELQIGSSQIIFPPSLWKVSCSLKIILFSWLVFHNKNLTWTNLQKRSWQGPAICMICLDNSDDNLHTFLYYPQSLSLWGQLATYFGFPAISHPSIIEAYIWWAAQKKLSGAHPIDYFLVHLEVEEQQNLPNQQRTFQLYYG